MDNIQIANIVFDFILIAAAVWMVVVVRGVGGVVGRTLSLITIGALILGLAHLLATVVARVAGPDSAMALSAPLQGLLHRVVVLSGFILLVFGFRNIAKIA